MASPGDSLGGRYRLVDRIAAGGMGEVWQAVDTVLDRPVAVKVLLAGIAAQSTFQRRFAHEARAMAALRHPGVAAVYDYGTTDEGAYLVMARIDGESLERRLSERGRLGPDETMTLVAQAARALHAAHQAGIVHRDVTPGNLIIEPDGNVVLVDFGVARSSASETLTGARNVIGTASYMAPEQVSKRVIGPAADLYALGAVAYHCLAGHPPFTGDDPVAIALRHVTEPVPPLPPDVPAAVRALVERCLAKDPAARHPSAAVLAMAATGVGGADPARLASEPTTIPLPRPPAPTYPGTPGAGTEAGTKAGTRAENGPEAGAGVAARTGAGTKIAGGTSARDVWGVVLATTASLLIGAGTAVAVADPYGWFSGPPLPGGPEASGAPGPIVSIAPSPPPSLTPTPTPRRNPPRTPRPRRTTSAPASGSAPASLSPPTSPSDTPSTTTTDPDDPSAPADGGEAG